MANQDPLICDESLVTVSGDSFETNSPVNDGHRISLGGTSAGGYDCRGGSAAVGEFTELSRVTVEYRGQHDPI